MWDGLSNKEFYLLKDSQKLFIILELNYLDSLISLKLHTVWMSFS